jgi:Luciferase-like monooxygenase
MSGPIKFMILAIVVGIEKSPTYLFLKIVVQRSTIHTDLAQLYSEDGDLPMVYARTAEWLEVVGQMWKRDHFSFSGKYYQVEDSILQPKLVSEPRPVVYAGGESGAAKERTLRCLRHAW